MDKHWYNPFCAKQETQSRDDKSVANTQMSVPSENGEVSAPRPQIVPRKCDAPLGDNPTLATYHAVPDTSRKPGTPAEVQNTISRIVTEKQGEYVRVRNDLFEKIPRTDQHSIFKEEKGFENLKIGSADPNLAADAQFYVPQHQQVTRAIYIQKIKELELNLLKIKTENAFLKDENQNLTKQLQTLEATVKLDAGDAMHLKSEIAAASLRERGLKAVIDDQHQELLKNFMEREPKAAPAEELTNLKTQLASTQIELTKLHQSRSEAFATIHSLTKDVAKLNREIEKLQLPRNDSPAGEMYVLQAQLDIFKADFDAERAEKEVLKEGREKLSTELQNMQRHNQKLQEEIEMMRQHRDVYGYLEMTRRGGSSSDAASVTSQPSMTCPKCTFGFKTLHALQNHVNRCLDLEDGLP